jgi:hypothetical protein
LDKTLKILVAGATIAAALAAFCATSNDISTARHEQKIASLESTIAALQAKCMKASPPLGGPSSPAAQSRSHVDPALEQELQRRGLLGGGTSPQPSGPDQPSEETAKSEKGYGHDPLVCDPKKLSGYTGLIGIQKGFVGKAERN